MLLPDGTIRARAGAICKGEQGAEGGVGDHSPGLMPYAPQAQPGSRGWGGLRFLDPRDEPGPLPDLDCRMIALHCRGRGQGELIAGEAAIFGHGEVVLGVEPVKAIDRHGRSVPRRDACCL